MSQAQWEEARRLTSQILSLGSAPGHTASPGHSGNLFKSDFFFFFKHNTDPCPDTESDSPYGMSVSYSYNIKHASQVAMATSVTQGPSGSLVLPSSQPPCLRADHRPHFILHTRLTLHWEWSSLRPPGVQKGHEAAPPAEDSGLKALWHSSRATSPKPGEVSVISTFYR